MKKDYLIVCLVQAINIASSVLFSTTATSQDFTEAQKKERCQNNKNRIVELETQLNVTNADLSTSMTEKEMEDSRTKMIFLKGLLQRGLIKDDEMIKLQRIGAQYNFQYKNCSDKNTYDVGVCIRALRDIITKKIDKAAGLQDKQPELLTKKKEIEEQIAVHKDNLITLGCNELSITNGDNFDYSKISGTWQSDWGPVTLYVNKSAVSGSWKQSPTQTGQITGGSFDAKTKNLTFTYSQAWNVRTGKVALVFSETAVAYSLSGSWEHDGGHGSGGWSLKKPK